MNDITLVIARIDDTRAKPLHRAGKCACAWMGELDKDKKTAQTHLICRIANLGRIAGAEDGLHARFPLGGCRRPTQGATPKLERATGKRKQ